MITLKGGSAIYEGTSGDSKPTAGIDVNTLYHELDTNKWYYFKTDSTWGEVPNTGGGGGGGFTPTEEQLAAMNSGITAEKLQNDENDISLIQQKTVGMDAGGSNYISVNGHKIFVDSSTPTGASTGDLWFGV